MADLNSYINIAANNVLTTGVVSASGNVRGANINTAGIVSATGNIYGDVFVGNGSALTGITASASLAGNLVGNIDANTFYINNLLSISTTGNIRGDYFIGNGSQLTGITATPSFGNSIAIGTSATANSTNGIAIGAQSGNTNQGSSSIAIGVSAMANATANTTGAIAIGYSAGISNQGANSIAIGYQAGRVNLANHAIIIGTGGSGLPNYAANIIAIGTYAAQSVSAQYGDSGVFIGKYAGAGGFASGNNAIAIGTSAMGNNTNTGFQVNAIAIGSSAGFVDQGVAAISIGTSAGQTTQGQNSVAIGVSAGGASQSANAVAIGQSAGKTSQGANSVAIGTFAGFQSLSGNSIAIGYGAANISSAGNIIVLNASGANLRGATANAFYVNPVRNDAVTAIGNVLVYNTTTKEVAYSNTISVSGTIRGSVLSGSLSTAAQPNITSVGTLLSLNTTGDITSDGNVTGNNISTMGNVLSGFGISAAGNVLVGADISVAGNVIAGSGLYTRSDYYGNTAGDPTGFVHINGNTYIGGDLTLLNGTTSGPGYGNGYITANVFFAQSQISAFGNITVDPSSYFIGNGSQLSGMYGNSNVGILLNTFNGPIYVSNITATGSISAAGNITGNVISGNGAGLTNIAVTLIGNVQGAQANVTLVAGSYSWTFDNTGKATFPKQLTTTPVPLANLTAVAGARAFVNDSNLAAAGNFGVQISGGSGNTVPVWSNGTNWFIG